VDPVRTEAASPALRHGEKPVYGLAFSPDGQFLASSSELEGTIKLWSADSGEPHGQPMQHAFVWDLAFSPDGGTLAAGSTKGTAQLWDVATQKPHGTPLIEKEGDHGVLISPAGDVVAVVSQNGAQLFDLDTGQPQAPRVAYEGVNAGRSSAPMAVCWRWDMSMGPFACGRRPPASALPSSSTTAPSAS